MEVFPQEMTPQVAGGGWTDFCGNVTDGCGNNATAGCLTGWSEARDQCIPTFIC